MAHKRVFDILVLAGLVLALGVRPGSASSALAAERPVAVSPGSASTVALIGDGCPTFSWGAADGAKSYELVVYRLAEEGEEAQPVLSETLAGSASSWTPSLDRCLERGGRYAWSVRAVGGKEASEWSAPSLFEVASGPSEAEFGEALEIVRQFLAMERGGEAEGAAEEDLEVKSEGKAPTPTLGSAVVGTTQLSVDGGVVATSFTGDGSTLTALDPANLAAAVQLAQGGTGATDAAGARTNLGVVAGPHTTDTTCNGVACDGSNLTNVTAQNLDCAVVGCVSTFEIAPTAVDSTRLATILTGPHEFTKLYVPFSGTGATGVVSTSGGADAHIFTDFLCDELAERGKIRMSTILNEGDVLCYCGCQSIDAAGNCPASNIAWQCFSE